MSAQLAFDLEAALEDVEDQRELDRLGADAAGRPGIPTAGRPGRAGVTRRPTIGYVKVRMAAVLQAAREPDEPHAYRQSLIDLGAICAEAAAALPRPDVQADAAA